MRQISHVYFALFATCLFLGLTTTVTAQQSKPGQKPAATNGNKQSAQTKAAPTRTANVPDEKKLKPEETKEVVEELPPGLVELLETWEEKSAAIKTMHGVQSRSEVNHTFKVEKITKGPFFLQTPDKGRIDMLEVPIKKGMKSNRLDKDGVPYALETDQSRKWICDGESILMLEEGDNNEKTYKRDEIPEDKRGKNIVHSPLPFLFGMKAEEAQARFKFRFEKDKNGKDRNTDTYAILLAKPKMAEDQQNYNWARITLDKKKYLPIEVRLYNDQSENVYTFESMEVNDRDVKSAWNRLWKINSDPYHPNLKGYKLIVENDDPIEAREIKQAADQKAAEKRGAPGAVRTAPRQNPPLTGRPGSSSKN